MTCVANSGPCCGAIAKGGCDCRGVLDGVMFGDLHENVTAPTFIPPLKMTVRVFSVIEVAVGCEFSHGGQRYRVKACRVGADVDEMGNIFHGYWIEGEEV